MPCTSTASARPPLEVADILRAELGDERERPGLSAAQRAAVRDILRCRTAQLGGHLEVCSQCGLARGLAGYLRCCCRLQKNWPFGMA